MVDSSFWLPPEKMSRLVQPLPVDPASGQKISVLDVSAEPMNDSGGAGALSTANDYLRFAQMLLNGGELDGARVVSRSEGRDRRCLHEPGPEPDSRVLPQDV
jgi:CubicO group peptidase (beta-lactamase class C family)